MNALSGLPLDDSLLEVDDVDALVQRALAAGIEIELSAVARPSLARSPAKARGRSHRQLV